MNVIRLGWTLVHFLWQGIAIAGVYALAHGFSAQRRYVLACAALAAMLAAPVATYVLLASPDEPVTAPVHHNAKASGVAFPLTVTEDAPLVSSANDSFERFMPRIVMVWLIGAVAFCLRLVIAWISAARLRTQQTHPASPEWQGAMERLKKRLRVARPVRLVVSGLAEVPSVVGWLRPVILMPVSALAGLPSEHVEAFLLHELAHIRRHDYFVNAVQGVAEALLFYHPAVWWISAEIRATRELCCDDLAVSATGDAFTYASALADLEATRPIHALAANGGNLADRIARILGRSRPESRVVSAPGAAAAVILAGAACLAFAQSAERPKFEVAAIKPVQGASSSNFSSLPTGRLRAENFSLRLLMMNAYHLQDFQIVGGPSWLGDEGFDVEAKGDPGDKERVSLMLQSLIEERFKLQYHRETRDLPVYSLSLVKGGGKLPAPKEGGCVKADPNAPPPAPPKPGEVPVSQCGRLAITMTPKGAGLVGGEIAMSEFVRRISMMLGRPVLDRTGVTANFDVRMQFTIDETLDGMSRPFGNVAGHREMMMPNASNDPNAPPPFLVALREQLGLKLDSTKGPAEVMVIDHVEKPSGN